MEQRARLRVNIASREFEVEGSENFVREYAPVFQELLEGLRGGEVALSPPERKDTHAAGGSFGEYIQKLPRSATDVDKMLAAGFFVQGQSGDKAFSTGQANKLLTDQGIKVGNPSQCVKQSLISKRVFQVQRGRYRVAQPGVDHLSQLLGFEVSG